MSSKPALLANSPHFLPVAPPAARLPFNFPHAGLTREAPPLGDGISQEGWTVHHTRVRIGAGQSAYRRAQGLLRQWRHFELGWAFTNRPELKPGAGVVVTARSLFLWTHNPLKITFVEEGRRRWQPETAAPAVAAYGAQAAAGTGRKPPRPPSGRRFAFAHATLAGHQISGEERFAVEWDKGDNSVWYEVYTVSKPATPVATLAQPLLRFYQRRYAAQSAASMQRQMLEAGAS